LLRAELHCTWFDSLPARLLRAGEAVTFFTEDDAGQLRGIANVVRAAGGEVPDWMLTMKKERHHRKRAAPEAGGISTEPQAAKHKQQQQRQQRQKGQPAKKQEVGKQRQQHGSRQENGRQPVNGKQQASMKRPKPSKQGQ
jgi:superfamily II DNA/RNA helicase